MKAVEQGLLEEEMEREVLALEPGKGKTKIVGAKPGLRLRSGKMLADDRGKRQSVFRKN